MRFNMVEIAASLALLGSHNDAAIFRAEAGRPTCLQLTVGESDAGGVRGGGFEV